MKVKKKKKKKNQMIIYHSIEDEKLSKNDLNNYLKFFLFLRYKPLKVV